MPELTKTSRHRRPGRPSFPSSPSMYPTHGIRSESCSYGTRPAIEEHQTCAAPTRDSGVSTRQVDPRSARAAARAPRGGPFGTGRAGDGNGSHTPTNTTVDTYKLDGDRLRVEEVGACGTCQQGALRVASLGEERWSLCVRSRARARASRSVDRAHLLRQCGYCAHTMVAMGSPTYLQR